MRAASLFRFRCVGFLDGIHQANFSPLALALDSRLDAFVISAEQRKHRRDVRFIPDLEADPPRIGQMMMRRNFAPGDELITDRQWKRKIDDGTAVEVVIVQDVPTLVLLFVVHFVFCPDEDLHPYHSPSDGAARSA